MDVFLTSCPIKLLEHTENPICVALKEAFIPLPLPWCFKGCIPVIVKVNGLTAKAVAVQIHQHSPPGSFALGVPVKTDCPF